MALNISMEPEPVVPSFSTVKMGQIWRLGPEKSFSQVVDSLTRLGLESSWMNVPGKIILSLPCVKVRWFWLILPTILNMSSLWLLILVRTETRKKRAHLWKASSIALLFRGLEQGTMTVPGYIHVIEMEEHAEMMNVKIKQSTTS